MVPKEGLETFRRIVCPAAPRGVAVSTTISKRASTSGSIFKSAALHARPELGVNCVAPRNETDLPLRRFFEEPTVAELAHAILPEKNGQLSAKPQESATIASV
jgi:hypothetical protein